MKNNNMARFMVIVIDDEGVQTATFFDSYEKAANYRSCADVSCGYRADLYEYCKLDPDDPYEPESYHEF